MNELFYRACTVRAKSRANQSAQLNLLRICSEAETIQIIGDSEGRDAGYICWASVCTETANIFLKFGEPPKFFYEYQEGDTCIVLDVFLSHGHCIDVTSLSRDFLRKYPKLLFRRSGILRTTMLSSVTGSPTLVRVKG